MKQIFEWLREQFQKRLDFYERRFEEMESTDKESVEDWGSIKSYKDALDIINEAEAKLEQDCCEWEKGSSGYVGYPAYYSKCCTTKSNGLEMQTHIISDWKYCPYCGKKIKVVE